MVRRLLLLGSLLAALLAYAAPAPAAIELGVQDDPLLVRMPTAFGGLGAARLLPEPRVEAALRALRVDTVRINVPWARVAGVMPSDPLDLGFYDLAVDRAIESGRRPQLTLAGPAPWWATPNHRTGALKPDPKRFAAFARAVALHFRGRVERYAIWNEPNWWRLLYPRRLNARMYRHLFLRGSRAIRKADPHAKVLFGELAPVGQAKAATSPLVFLRRATCSNRRWRASRRCSRLVADGFALHPYTLLHAPTYPGPNRNDVTMGSLGRLNAPLAILARRRALATPRRGSLPLYLTEWGYRHKPARIREPLRSRYVRRGLALAAHNRRVRQLVWYQLAGPPPKAHASWDSGLLDYRGRARPVYKAVRAWSAKRRRPPLPGLNLP